MIVYREISILGPYNKISIFAESPEVLKTGDLSNMIAFILMAYFGT